MLPAECSTRNATRAEEISVASQRCCQLFVSMLLMNLDVKNLRIRAALVVHLFCSCGQAERLTASYKRSFLAVPATRMPLSGNMTAARHTATEDFASASSKLAVKHTFRSLTTRQ